MKGRFFRRLIFIFCFCFLIGSAIGQPPPGDPPPANPVPITGIEILLGAGALLGAKRMLTKKKD